MGILPLISVVVPVYNAEHYLSKCIESVLNQTQKSLELILIDDCSTDGSFDLCRDAADHDERIVLLKNDRNIGQGLTRNRGIELSRGRFITFVDSDDTIDKRMYEILASMAVDNCAEIARCSFRRVRNHDENAFSVLPDANARCLFGQELSSYRDGYFGMLPDEALSDAPSASPCTALYDGDLIRAKGVRFPSERVVRSEDLFFNLQVSYAASRLVLTDLPLYNYLSRPGSTTKTYSSPLGKCRLLERLAPSGEEFDLRLTRSFLTAVKEACIQLASSGESLESSAQVIRNLEKDLELQSRLRRFPLNELPARERLFASAAAIGTGYIEASLGKLDQLRTK